MSTVGQFDTYSVRSWANPRLDTFAQVDFPRPFVAPPRIPVWIRQLDIGNNANIRAKVTTENITKTSAIYHITSWADTTNYSGSSSSFNLAPTNLEFLTGEHLRDLNSDPKSPASKRIYFSRPFVTPPKVVVFFNYIDLDKSRNWRLKTTATDIDIHGFNLNMETWSDTILYAAQACWVAYPEDRPHIFSASAGSSNLDPNVFVAWNMFDIDCEANLRLGMQADNVTQQGLTWNINAWGDTVLYAAGATIIVVN